MANTTKTVEYRCPACEGLMRYLPGSEQLVCEYCGTKTTVEQLEEKQKEEKADQIEGFDFSSLKDQATDESAGDLPVCYCESCAAELIADVEQVAISCPYCGSRVMLSDKVSGKLRPDGIIPFQYEPSALADAVKKYYKGKKLLPRDFFSESRIGEVTGLYVPFWIFDGEVSGSLHYKGSRSSTSRDGNYVVTKTDYYRITRDVSMTFRNLPVDTSKKVDDALMDSLEPFDLSKAVPFDMAYLAGFAADRFDTPKSTTTQRARKRMTQSASALALSRAGSGYSNVTHQGGNLKTDLKAKYMLFPVYLFDVKYENETYSFAFNGQTGKVVGKLPIDKKVSRSYFWKRTLIPAGILFLFSLLTYWVGY